MQNLRSLIYNFIVWVSVLLYAPLSLLTFPLPARARFAFISKWGRVQVRLAKLICGLDYRVEGRERLPARPAIIMAKHQSTWETFAFQEIFPPHVWVLKRELLWVPLFGWALALLRPVAIDRGSGKQAIQQLIEQGRERLQAGYCVVVFPEGTRMPPRTRGRYKLGGAVLASATGYPVVPVAHNAGSFWPRRGFLKRAGTIRVVIGPTIESQGRSAEEIRQIAESWIEGTMQELEDQSPPAK